MHENLEAPRSRRFGRGAIFVSLVIAAAASFVLLNLLRDLRPSRVDIASGAQFPCTVQAVGDGEGPIDCGEADRQGEPVKVRPRGIAAHPSDAAARAELARLAVGRLRCTSFGQSSGHVDASCVTASGVDISCGMLTSGAAIRRPEQDPDGRLLACKPAKG